MFRVKAARQHTPTLGGFAKFGENTKMEQIRLLSRREKEVVTLLLQGKSNKQIALSLGVSERTIEFHLGMKIK